MDCCKTKEEDNCCKEIKVKGGNFRMDRRIIMWIVIAALFFLALFLTFKAGAVGSSGVQSATSVAKSAASSYGGMVGGC